MKLRVANVILPIATAIFLLISASNAIALPDLTFPTTASLSVSPTKVAAGSSINIGSATARNEGTNASGAFLIGVYLSTDALITIADDRIRRCADRDQSATGNTAQGTCTDRSRRGWVP